MDMMNQSQSLDRETKDRRKRDMRMSFPRLGKKEARLRMGKAINDLGKKKLEVGEDHGSSATSEFKLEMKVA